MAKRKRRVCVEAIEFVGNYGRQAISSGTELGGEILVGDVDKGQMAITPVIGGYFQ